MIKALIIGAFVLAVSFFVTGTIVHAQTATTSPTATPTMSPTPTTSTTVPNAAPATGFGN